MSVIAVGSRHGGTGGRRLAVGDGGIGLPAARPSREPTRFADDRIDIVECRHEFGDSGDVPTEPYDEPAPDKPGTLGNARHGLASDPQAKDPAITGAGSTTCS
ncbi:hypothetical protein GCM10010492_55400 [Saccharothrix mutabilis subsp. mutabilis]|uniref:Uncharacterized protein n=1 Tax=Saccharothrix mutabilis subsp. mutabilis TaxID=66855 RepID=A0ABP3E080_9PSEU